MKISKCFKHAFEMVLHSKLRSWLTIVGIVIGVAAVIAIMSLGSGLQESVSSQLGGLGGDILTLNAGFSRGGGFFGREGGRGGESNTATSKAVELTKTDAQVLRGVANVASIDTQIRGQVNVSYLGKSGKVALTGVDQKTWSKITTATLKEGRYLDSADQNVVVIQNGLASTYFGKPVGINQMIMIQGSAFRVVGILDDNGNSIFMPLQTAYHIIPDKNNTGVYDTIIIKMKDQEQLNATMTEIEGKLINSRHVTPATKDFSLTSNAQLQATRSQLLTSLNTFLLAIAAVSLLVGAIGIANTMFTSVIERTKEIGIMKAIGARNKDVLLIFLFNAALIGLVGGIIGVIAGGLLSGLLPTLLGNATPLTRGGTLVTLNSVILALSVSVIAGIVAGAIPAYRASKLRPVDALRYE